MSEMNSTYGRNAKPLAPQEPAPAAPSEEGVRVNGYAQVVAMLEAADPDFRASLLRRIAGRDPQLYHALRKSLAGEA